MKNNKDLEILKKFIKNFIKKLKKFSRVDVLILIFCFLTIGILNIRGGVYIIIVNILISCIISFYLVTKKANLAGFHIRKNFGLEYLYILKNILK